MTGLVPVEDRETSVMSKKHPLANVGLSVSNFKCFGEEPGGFPILQPINIVIGRNNSGKSTLVDLVKLCISKGKSYDPQKHGRSGQSFVVLIRQNLDQNTLQRAFPEGQRGGPVPGNNHWAYGKQFIGHPIELEFSTKWVPKFRSGPDLIGVRQNDWQHFFDVIAQAAPYPLENLSLFNVSAERDVQPEMRDINPRLDANGRGTTNLIRAYINRHDLPREEVITGLLNDLNIVYQGDCEFTEIFCQDDNNDLWELYLKEDTKGDIRLSESGSSLKSIFVILCMLRLWLPLRNISWSQIVFAIEEPENNLHPALLRRLLNFLADKRDEKEFTLIITTHSPICIDWSTRRSDSQIVHVTHDGTDAHTRAAVEYQQNREILEDLDIRASDILQANGIIWVEGPTDRIYIRRWLELISEGQLKEGVHYTIMFYGGKLLNHLNALPPSDRDELISLLSINRNAGVVIDSDRSPGKKGAHKPRMNLNETKRRIRDEMEAIGGFVWITQGREIENYTPIEVFARVVGKPAPDVGIYDQISKLPLLKDFKEVKINIASAVAPETQKRDLIDHLDVWPKLQELCDHIRRWNALTE